MFVRTTLGTLASFLFTTAVLLTPVGQALAQGCTDQLVQDFLDGWSNDLPRLAHCMVVLSFIAVALGFAPSAFGDGTVYAMTNQLTSAGGNNILVYHRASDGTLR